MAIYKSVINVLTSFIVYSFFYVPSGLLAQSHTIPTSTYSAGTKTTIVTYVSTAEQEKTVHALIKSIRERSKMYCHSKIMVVVTNLKDIPCSSLIQKDAELLPLEMDRSFLDYPLALKAFAAAQVEKKVASSCNTLIWLDPGVLVLNSMMALNLEDRFDAVLRPVTLANTISIAPNTEPNDYWQPIYQTLHLNYQSLPSLITIADQVNIQPYYNCEVFSLNPRLSICQEWATLLTQLLKDEKYQQTVCTTFLRKLFLHQAVLSGVISSKISPDKIKSLPLTSGYPFNQHEKLPASQLVSSLNELNIVIFDYAWEKIPTLMNKIPIQDPLKHWLTETYLEYLKVTDHLYRLEGSCNAFLITTPNGSVFIDPAGTAVAPEFFQFLLKKYPLKAILLTHVHPDHAANIEKWQTNPTIPVIAQRDYIKHTEYVNELTGFFARRNAIWAGKAIPAELPKTATPVFKPTITFIDHYTFKLGGFTFKMQHTPGETPDHTTIWIPELGAVFSGDNYYEYFINNATFRGTLIRPVLGYIRALDFALKLNPVFFLMGHGAPVVSQSKINQTIGNFRDALNFIYQETIKGINAGKDVYTIMQEIKLPAQYNLQQFYGKVEWTVRGIYQEYVGWFDENPSTMYPVPVSSIYPELVELVGMENIIKKAQTYLDTKEYVKVLHFTDIILKADPFHIGANKIRLQALKALKTETNNFIETIWLNYGIRICEENLKSTMALPSNQIAH